MDKVNKFKRKWFINLHILFKNIYINQIVEINKKSVQFKTNIVLCKFKTVYTQI
jgi:hypothetical protein